MKKRVGVYPLIPCGKCKFCDTGHPEMCRDYDYMGSRRNGAFAENVAVPASNLIELPESVSYEAAAMLEPMAVAVHVMRMALDNGAHVNRDAKIVICGLGTIGLLLLSFLMERGYKEIFVVGKSDGQRKRAAGLGLAEDHYCDYKAAETAAWICDRTEGGAEV